MINFRISITTQKGRVMEIGSYSKIYNLGHKAIERLFDDPVIVEEKIDDETNRYASTRIHCQFEAKSRYSNF